MTEGKLGCSLTDIKSKVITHETTKTVIKEVKKYYPVEKIKEVKHIPHSYLVSAWLLWVFVAGAIVYFVFSKLKPLWIQIAKLAIGLVGTFKKKS